MIKAKYKIKEIHGIHLIDRIKNKLTFFKLNLTDIKINLKRTNLKKKIIQFLKKMAI